MSLWTTITGIDIAFRKGSVVVEHEVVLKEPFAGAEEEEVHCLINDAVQETDSVVGATASLSQETGESLFCLLNTYHMYGSLCPYNQCVHTIKIYEALDNILQRITKTSHDEIPTMDEMAGAIVGLKDGKAPGGDGIPAEVWKHGGDNLFSKLHQLITNA